jgi:hypothetical protein
MVNFLFPDMKHVEELTHATRGIECLLCQFHATNAPRNIEAEANSSMLRLAWGRNQNLRHLLLTYVPANFQEA